MGFKSPEIISNYSGHIEEPALNENLITKISDSRMAGNFSLAADNQPIEITSSKTLGAGGSKEVYDAKIEGLRYAVAIPAAGIDDSRTIKEKWGEVLKEPSNTARIRQLGLRANDVCEIFPITINGFEFPALRMHRFEDLPYEIKDAKNIHSSTGNSPVFLENMDKPSIDKEKLSQTIKNIGEDIKILIDQGITLKKDSFNICIDNENIHLYFNDLGSAKFSKIPETDRSKYIEFYSHCAAQALVMAPSKAEYAKLKDTLDYEYLQKQIEKAIV